MSANFPNFIGQIIGLALGAYLSSIVIAQLKGSDRNVTPQTSELPANVAHAIPRPATSVVDWPPKLLQAIQELPLLEQARARQFLKELGTKGWNGASPELREEFAPLFMEHCLIDFIKLAIKARANPREWAQLSTDEQKCYSSLIAEAHKTLVEWVLSTSKQQWDVLSTEDRITRCNCVKSYLHALGATEVEKSQYSVFLGDFMDESASHVTLRDSVAVFCEQVGQRRRAKNLAALNEIVDLSLAGAQILQVFSQSSERRFQRDRNGGSLKAFLLPWRLSISLI